MEARKSFPNQRSCDMGGGICWFIVLVIVTIRYQKVLSDRELLRSFDLFRVLIN